MSTWICSGGSSTSPDTCVPNCGDGILVGNETCDDGSNDGFGSNSDCTDVLPGFYCDPSSSGPNANITYTICGDGLVAGYETCDIDILTDPSNINSTCLNQTSCIGPATGWTCAGGTPTSPSTCTPICGDGLLRGYETCDDGSNDAFGANSTCTGVH